MNNPAASSGVWFSVLGRHSVLDTESSSISWIPAFAGMTDSRQAAGNLPGVIKSTVGVQRLILRSLAKSLNRFIKLP